MSRRLTSRRAAVSLIAVLTITFTAFAKWTDYLPAFLLSDSSTSASSVSDHSSESSTEYLDPISFLTSRSDSATTSPQDTTAPTPARLLVGPVTVAGSTGANGAFFKPKGCFRCY